METISSEQLTAVGLVEEVDDQNLVYIRTQSETGCSSCSASSSCGTSLLSSLFVGRSRNLIKVPNNLGCKPGDKVELSLQNSALLQQAFLVYILPLFGLFIGAALAQSLQPGLVEWQQLLAGFGGMLVAWLGVKIFYQPVSPKVIRVVDY